jgi:hypothetical protein
VATNRGFTATEPVRLDEVELVELDLPPLPPPQAAPTIARTVKTTVIRNRLRCMLLAFSESSLNIAAGE